MYMPVLHLGWLEKKTLNDPNLWNVETAAALGSKVDCKVVQLSRPCDKSCGLNSWGQVRLKAD